MSRRRRKAPPRGIGKAFAFVVDGETEFWYLQMLKRHERYNLPISIEPQIPQKETLKKQFERVRRLSEDYSKVFWVIDLDEVMKETREKAKGQETTIEELVRYRKALKDQELENVILIINNPCLEFWLLLHFTYTSKLFKNCNSANKDLGTHLPNYEKTKRYYTQKNNDIFLRFSPFLNDALKHANRLGRFDAENPNRTLSEMYLLFEVEEFAKVLTRYKSNR